MEFKQCFGGENLFEMTHLVQRITGLPYIIWISTKKDHLPPVIGVQGDYEDKLNLDLVFALTISDRPEIVGENGILTSKDIRLIQEFVVVNKHTLLDFWYEVDIDLLSIISRLQKVKN